MDSVTMAEELAWLVKDNLSCKHLVLSAEEAFVTFLDPQQTSSVGKVLTLKPMAAYHRMLLHRLADIFRLAHESIGEGEDRRLVLERCEDSCIPNVLVSDILECNENTEPQISPVLLKRSSNFADVHEYAGAQSSQVSFEERKAAYLAARERIFSEDLNPLVNESAIARPRSVPVVARRMIAHALGKRISAEQTTAVNSDPAATIKLDTTCSGLDFKVPTERTEADAACATVVANPQPEPLKIESLQTKAAKRMFAQALGVGSSKSSYCRIPSRSGEEKKDSLRLVKSQADVRENPSQEARDMLEGGQTINVSTDQSGQPGAVGVAQLEQGKAAQRMLAQALGVRSLSIAAERPRKS